MRVTKSHWCSCLVSLTCFYDILSFIIIIIIIIAITTSYSYTFYTQKDSHKLITHKLTRKLRRERDELQEEPTTLLLFSHLFAV